MKRTLMLLLAIAPITSFGQLGVAANMGYNLPTGEHHSAFEKNLLVKTDYSNKKVLNYCSSFKIDYSSKHINFGIGLEYGNYQTKKETDISILSSLIPSSSFIAASGRYISPYIFVNYRLHLSRKFMIQGGIMTGMFTSGLGKDQGIVVIETEPILGIIPGQTIGVEAKSGAIGKDNSTKLVSGAQVELGYTLIKNLQIHLEFAARNTNVDAKVAVSGIEQPVNYTIWNYSVRTGIRYSFARLKL